MRTAESLVCVRLGRRNRWLTGGWQQSVASMELMHGFLLEESRSQRASGRDLAGLFGVGNGASTHCFGNS